MPIRFEAWQICDWVHPGSSCHGCQSVVETTMRSSTNVSLYFWRGASAVIAEIARLNRALFRGSRISDGTDASGSGCLGTPLTGVKRHGQRRAEEARWTVP